MCYYFKIDWMPEKIVSNFYLNIENMIDFGVIKNRFLFTFDWLE